MLQLRPNCECCNRDLLPATRHRPSRYSKRHDERPCQALATGQVGRPVPPVRGHPFPLCSGRRQTPRPMHCRQSAGTEVQAVRGGGEERVRKVRNFLAQSTYFCLSTATERPEATNANPAPTFSPATTRGFWRSQDDSCDEKTPINAKPMAVRNANQQPYTNI